MSTPDNIQIPRSRAGAIAQALDSQAETVLRESRSRAYTGPQFAELRAGRRERAAALQADATAIRAELRA